MPPKSPIDSPAGYATPFAVGYADSAGDLALVTTDSPLPVTIVAPAQPQPPMAGEAITSGLIGPYAAAVGLPIHLQTSGVWEGRVSLLRSVDGGATTSGLTAAGIRWASFTGNVNEVVWQDSDASATFYLDIALTTGAVTYRVSQ